MNLPQPLECGNTGDGSPLTLGDPEAIGDLFLPSGHPILLDWDGDGAIELVDSGDGICTWKFVGTIADGTPIVDRGIRWGFMSRSHHKDENDFGICGKITAAGDFDGDGTPEIIVAPRAYSKAPVVVLRLTDGPPTDRSGGVELDVLDSALPEGEGIEKWRGVEMTPFDWDGDGRIDAIAGIHTSENYWKLDPKTGRCPEDQRDRYDKLGRWKGVAGECSLQLMRNTGTAESPQFTYAGPVGLPVPPPGGRITPVDPTDPTAGLLIIDEQSRLWHLPLLSTGPTPKWGELKELVDLHGATFNRAANFGQIFVGSIEPGGRMDLIAQDISSNAMWCRSYGRDQEGRPIYDSPRKIKQRDPMVNGGSMSTITTGDWRNTGTADLLVGSVQGHVFWYKTLSTNPLRFAPPERVRVADQEIRRYGKPHPAAGYHWGTSQGPSDGFNGGYSNPALVDWDGDGLLDLIMGDMIGLYDWYPNRGTKSQPELAPPHRLHVGDEPLIAPWRVQPGVGDFTGDGLPDVVTMDLDLDLSLYRRVGPDDLTGLQPGVKLLYEDGGVIKTHGPYTPQGGDGRGRSKVQVVDWDHNGKLDLVVGVGPQPGSEFTSSFVLLLRNVGTNAEPVFKRPEVLLYDSEGKPLQFFRHSSHPGVVDWDGDGKWELLVGADLGFVWYFKPENFGKAVGEFEIFRDEDDKSL
jgi:hypothetical protein